MSKIVKINESQMKRIVDRMVTEHMGEYQPTMADAQVDEAPEMQDEPETHGTIQAGIAKGPDGRFYVLDIETGDIIAVK
jgi:hypothetical protein